MQEFKTVARPYAKALFAIAQNEGNAVVWLDVLKVLSCFAEQERFEALATNPEVTAEHLCQFLVTCVLEQVSLAESIKTAIEQFISVLYCDKRLAALPYILILFQQLWVDSQDAVAVEVTSAFDLSAPQQDQFKVSLARRFAATVDVTFKTDPSIIGGAIIRRGSWVMDGSVHGKLSGLIDSMRG